jgi:phospholipid/cholesterol/gamma-HCH transport system substrate-binding protein
MPSNRRITWAQLRVGIMAVVAIVILFVLIFLLTGNKNIFGSEATLYTFMDDSAAMTEGSAVRLNGIMIGQVKKIALSGSRDPNQTVRFDMEVRQDMLRSIPIDSLVTIGAENVLGTKFLNIKQGKDPQHVENGATLKAREDRDFLEIMQSAQPILDSMQVTLRRIDAIVGLVEAGKGSIGKLLVDETVYNRLNAILADAQKISSTLVSGQGTVGKLFYDESLYNDIRGTIAKADALIADLQAGQGTAGKLLKDPKLYDDMNKSVVELRNLLEGLNRGEGTAGKLLKSPELHDQILATLKRADTTLTMLNSGQGTLGQLLVNPSLYDTLNGTTKEAHELIKDFRANPKKFLRIKLGLF